MYKDILKNNVLSVSEYIELLNGIINECRAKIEGEVTQLKIDRKGHVYFTIKDSKGSVLDCICWNYNYRMCGIKLEEGMQIILGGSASIYPAYGKLSFKADTIELIGEGALKKQYEKLKEKLQQQGVFDNKKELPAYPKKIGIITSKNGAVIHDFLTNLKPYGFQIEFIDSRVEGIEAAEELISSIKTFKKEKLDCLVVMRGGGSLESFLAFNNEAVINEIIDCPFPIIAGLGHEKDVPLFALASDYIASTPTAVANILNTSWDEMIYEFEKYHQAIIEKYSSIISNFDYKIQLLIANFNRIKEEIRQKNILLDEYKKDIVKNFELHIKKINEKIKTIEKEISYSDPKRQLKLGYSIATFNGKIIKSIDDVGLEDKIDLEVSDGIIKSKIYGRQKK